MSGFFVSILLIALRAMSQTDFVGINDIDATELPDYRPLCVSAAVGLVLGLLSFLALLHPVMWFVPVVAVAVNAFALMSVSRSERMVGRNAALCGLFAALLFGIGAPLRTVTYHWLARREANRFGREWLQAILEGNVHKAHQMASMPADRKPIDEQLPGLYAHTTAMQTELENYLKSPAVAKLRTLGTSASVRHERTESSESDGRNDLVKDLYTVTYEENGQQRTTVLQLSLWRNLKSDVGPRLWRVQTPEWNYRPKGS